MGRSDAWIARLPPREGARSRRTHDLCCTWRPKRQRASWLVFRWSDLVVPEPLRMDLPLDLRVLARPSQHPRPRWELIRCFAIRLLTLVLPAVLLTVHAVGSHAGHDYIEFHAAARLLAQGENPYG